jgi:hypothetical protein
MSSIFAFASSVGRQWELSYSFFESFKNKVRQTGQSKVSVVARGWVKFGLAPRKCGSGVETQGVARVVLSFILDSRTTLTTDKLLPLPQPPVRARTDAQTNPSAQRATQLRRVLARVYAVSIQNQITTTVP